MKIIFKNLLLHPQSIHMIIIIKKCSAFCVAAIIFFSSCKQYAISKYEIGRKFDFKTKVAYKEYLLKKQLIPLSHFVYADSSGYQQLMSDLIKGKITDVILGYYLNDSERVKHGAALNEKSYCAKRIEDEMERNANTIEFEDSVKEKATALSRYRLKTLTEDKLMELPGVHQKKLMLLLYFVGYGSYYDRMYKNIFSIQQQYAQKNDLYIICMDPVYQLKPSS